MKCMSIQRLVNMNTHSSFIHNSQKLEGTKMSINRCVHGVNSVPIQWNTKPPARNTMDYGDMQQSEFPKRSVRRKEVRHKSVHPVSVHLCEILGKENRDNESIKTKADQWLPGAGRTVDWAQGKGLAGMRKMLCVWIVVAFTRSIHLSKPTKLFYIGSFYYM